MSRIEISQRILASADVVWSHLADLKSHSEWMKDAVSIEFLTEATTGVGTKMMVPTRIGPFRTNDVLEVVEWSDGGSIGVKHRGIVSGTGRFSLRTDDNGTLLTWTEDLRFPWWLGGPVTACVARPVLSRVWRGNLRRFAEMVETDRPFFARPRA